jgi:DNA polymerase alpha subunit B
MTDAEDFANQSKRYRYMFTTLIERSQALERYMLSLQSDMTASKAIIPDELQPVGCPAPEVVWVSGRICCDAAEGKINSTSIVLEGSAKFSNGRRVHLDIRNLQSYAFFPGQIVLAEGVMNSVQKMSVQSIVTGVPRPLRMSTPSKLFEYHHSPIYQGGRPVSVMCAAGPFTPADSLNYEPLEDIFKLVLAYKPDVLVLTGPFVDMTQAHLSNGETRVADTLSHEHIASYEMIFIEKIIRDGLGSYFNSDEMNNLPTQIVLVPSLLDGHHDYVYPQPPFGTKREIRTHLFGSDDALGKLEFPHSEGREKRVHLMPNPCMFRYVIFTAICCISLKFIEIVLLFVVLTKCYSG